MNAQELHKNDAADVVKLLANTPINAAQWNVLIRIMHRRYTAGMNRAKAIADRSSLVRRATIVRAIEEDLANVTPP